MHIMQSPLIPVKALASPGPGRASASAAFVRALLCQAHSRLYCRFVRRLLVAFCCLVLVLPALLWICATRGTQPQPSRQFKIPRLIHFTSRSEILRSEYRSMMEHWLARNPDVKFYLWRDSDAVCLARLRYQRWLPALNGSGQWLQTPLERSDLTRIMALHALGGLYLDLDTVPVADLRHLLDRPLAGAMFATEPTEHASLLFQLDYLVSNAVMFSAPGHPFLTAYMDAIEAIVTKDKRRRDNLNAPEITGPIVMHRTYERFRTEVTCSSPECRVHLFQPEVFCPVYDPMQTSWLKTVCNATTLHKLPDRRRSVCVQLWARNFTQATVTNATLAIHQFSHISSVKSNRKPTYFNASEVFPRLQFFADTERDC